MVDIKISELDPADQANASDLLEASQEQAPGYVTKKITLDQVSTVVAASDQISDVIEEAIGDIPPIDLSAYALLDSPTFIGVPLAPTPVSGPAAQIATLGWVQSHIGPLLALKANLISPTFTGDPKAPTPTYPDNDTSLATTEFVTTAQADTASQFNAALALKADLASPVFTGNPTAPTPTYPDNDVSIATTAYVTAALAAGASISVGIAPPGSPAANQLWWNSDASVGGGQLFIWYNDGSTTQWVPASPAAGTGSVVQTVSFQTGAVATGTITIPNDDTIPQITEGVEFLTLSITPKSATSKLIIETQMVLSHSTNPAFMSLCLFQDSAANALAATMHVINGSAAGQPITIPLRHSMISGTTSPTTLRVRAGSPSAGTVTLNGSAGVRIYGGVMASSIVIQEVL